MSERKSPETPAPGGAASSTAPASGNQVAAEDKVWAHLFDVSPYPTVVTSLADHKILAINQHTSELFGVTQAEVIGQSVLDYYVDEGARARLADALRRYGRVDSLRFHVRRKKSDAFWVLASARLVTFNGVDAVLTVFEDITDQLAAEQALKASEQRMVTQSKVLTQLTGRHADRRGTFDDELCEILRAMGDTLKVERVSMWRIDDKRSAIRCVTMFHRKDNRHESGAVLPREAAPEYFFSLERDRIIAAENVLTDPRTREFKESYLVPNGIGAMLDIPLRQDDKMYGVLCCEHIGGPREWMIDEQNFALSAANLIVVAATDEERRAAVARLAESDARAQLILETAHDAFVGMDASGRIVTWNARAEAMFGWPRAEAIGRPLVETIIPPVFRDAHLKGIQRFHDTGEASVVNKILELTALTRDGGEIPIELTIAPPLRVGQSLFFGAFVRDMRERRHQEAALRQAKSEGVAITKNT